MKPRKLLLATAALTTAISCGGKKKEPVIYANPKGGHYDPGLTDAGVDAPPPPPPPDAGAAEVGPGSGDPQIYANTKGSFYDDGLVKKPQ